jgi:primary-amine oxidase
MSRFRGIRVLLIGGWVVTLAAASAGAREKPGAEPVQDMASGLSITVPEEFLTTGGCSMSACLGDPCRSGSTACKELKCPETSWRVCIQDKGLKGLWVGPVDLKRKADSAWMRVLYDTGPAEIFVPYHRGAPRLYDMQFCTPPNVCLREVFPEDAGATGQLVKLSGDTAPRVVAEVRDRGLAWLCKENIGGTEVSHVRRGEEMLLWGVYDTGNYDYILQYGFRDDGSISFRVGATGYNNPGKDDPSMPFEPHMHDVLWYIDMDLRGNTNDTAWIFDHQEPLPGAIATDQDQIFNGGFEGALDWDPLSFRSVLLEDISKNAHGRHLGYELVPFRTGTARHDEQFTRSDFWVTLYRGSELGWTTAHQVPERYLLGISDGISGIANHESILNQDLVLWHLSSAHHEPHDEDQATGNSEMEGITLVHWMGGELAPHNLFDENPLGGPHRSLCQP